MEGEPALDGEGGGAESLPPLKFRTVAVLGATGGVGRYLVRLALERGMTVRALARNPAALAPQEGLTVVAGDAFDAEAVAEVVRGSDAVLVALGSRQPRDPNPVCSAGVRNALKAMQPSESNTNPSPCQRIVAVSSGGVGPREAYPWLSRLLLIDFFLKTLHAHEFRDLQGMEDLLAGSSSNWTVVRPSSLTNGRPRRQEDWVASEDPREIRPFVARVDVARFMLDSLADPSRQRKSLVLAYEMPYERWWYSCWRIRNS